MNLFKLMAVIGLDSKEFETGVNKATEQGKKLAHGLGHGLVAGAKMAGKALVAVGTAATGLAIAATKQYADYEQLVGGVETLFKSSAGTIQTYAAQAYRTAGLSANQYMEQATSFSASLIQSLGGDTAAAAEYANKAIVDMSDNANKMGTDIGMIQNAYQGFAKQNYTMLDNLKLGYGGTKEEMKRLLEDAEKLSGKKFDMSSYADIIEAIHVIQEEMGVTGTTALEASETISGSFGMVKASFSNLLVGIADDNANFDDLVNQFVESVGIAAQNIGPRFVTALEGVAKLIEQMFPVIMDALPRIITETLPKIATSAANILKTLVKGIHDNRRELARTAMDLIGLFIRTIIDTFPDIIETAADLLVSFLDEIAAHPDEAIDTAIELVGCLVKGIFEALPKIVTAAAKAIGALIDELVHNFPEVVKTGGEILGQVCKGILQSLNSIVNLGWDIVDSLIDGIASAWHRLVNWFQDKWNSLVGGLSIDVDVNESSSSGSYYPDYDYDPEPEYTGPSRPQTPGWTPGPQRPGYRPEDHKSTSSGSFKSGLEYVPFDGFVATLHEGERILTKEEAHAYKNGGVNMGGVTININGANYSDPESLAEIIAEELQNMTYRRAAVYG